MPRPLIRMLIAAALILMVVAVLLSRRLFTPPRPTYPAAVVLSTPATVLASPIATDPNSAVTLGEQFERDGDYTGALAQLQPYVGRGGPATDADVRFVLARVLLEAGREVDARAASQTVRTLYPASRQADLAQFLLGEAQERLGDHAAAIADYRAFDVRHPELDAYVQLQIAGSLKAENQLGQAQTIADAVAGNAPIPAVALDALDTIRAIQTVRGDFHGYLATTDRLLATATDPSYRTQLTFERGWAEQAIQDRPAAVADFRTVIVTAPTSSFAPRALTGLVQLNATGAITPEQQGIVLYDDGQYNTAIGIFSSAIQANPRSDTAWYYRALCRLKNGDDAGAEADLQGLSQGFPDSQYVPAALYRAGRLQEDAGQLNDAQATYQTLVEQYGSAPEAIDGRFRLGFIEYLKGGYPAAERAWSPAGLLGSDAARADFWLAKARLAAGDRKGAQTALMAAVGADPDGYYGLRAQDLMGGDTAATPIIATPPPVPSAWGSPSASPVPGPAPASWYAVQGTDASSALTAMQADAGYRRVSSLFDLGLRSSAVDELTALSSRDKGDPATLAALATLLTDRGELRSAYPIGRMAITASRARSLPVPPQIVALAYPLPYASEVGSSAGTRGVDPFLLLALMRQESGYIPSAQSPAGALGLTQVMPDTGRSIANALGVTTFQPGQLLQPAVSIDFGAFYLSDQLKHYRGQLFPAIAAYNAGDGAVDAWLKQPGAADPDVFAELIPYPETHDYLQIVFSNYLHYLRAYRASAP